MVIGIYESTADSNLLAETSAAFKAKPGFRTAEAKILLPLITNGMVRPQILDLLGEPQRDGPLGSSTNRWNYCVFYSTVLTITFENDRVENTEATGFQSNTK